MLVVNNAYVHAYPMHQTTPFFDSLAPCSLASLRSRLAQAFAKASKCKCLGQLRKLFGSYIPQTLLDRRPSGANSRKREKKGSEKESGRNGANLGGIGTIGGPGGVGRFREIPGSVSGNFRISSMIVSKTR